PTTPALFPYTTLFRSRAGRSWSGGNGNRRTATPVEAWRRSPGPSRSTGPRRRQSGRSGAPLLRSVELGVGVGVEHFDDVGDGALDRKSTRLNSSHDQI